jgi:hypothetical protein
MPLELIHSDV